MAREPVVSGRAGAPPPAYALLPGRLPLRPLLFVESILVVGLLLLLADPSRWPWTATLVVLALGACVRRHGRTPIDRVSSGLAFLVRARHRSAGPGGLELLRLVAGDLALTGTAGHGRRPIGVAWCDGACTAVLVVQPAPSRSTVLHRVDDEAVVLPVDALAGCVTGTDFTLDGIRVLVHASSGAAPDSAAVAAYRQVLGDLPVAVRRTTLVAVTLDPRRWPLAVAERGGGVAGAHRILVAALARVQQVLEGAGAATRPLDREGLLNASLHCAGLTDQPRPESGRAAALRERWRSVSAGGTGHRSYAVVGWPAAETLESLTGVGASSATLALSLVPTDGGVVGVRGLVRLSAASPSQLASAHRRLITHTVRAGAALLPLDGRQRAGLGASLPVGGAA